MAITTQGKLSELRKIGKTDGSIQNEYDDVNLQYKSAKATYKISREAYKVAKNEYEMAKQNFVDSPLLKKFKALKNLRKTKKKMKKQEIKYQMDRAKYKKRLYELKDLRREIKGNYKSYKDYNKFFQRVQEAQKEGIALPMYIIDEYNKQKSVYQSLEYVIDKNGQKSYILQPNNACSKDVSSLIWEKSRKNVKENVQKVAEHMKNRFSPER